MIGFYKISGISLKYLPFLLPLLLLPLLIEWIVITVDNFAFQALSDILFGFDLFYIFAVRFMILDLILFFVSRNDRTSRFALLEVVFLYLEVTFITIVYFGFLYNLFGLFNLFRFAGNLVPAELQQIETHPLILGMYISVQNFTTLGLGDWLPQTLGAMVAVSLEAILGFVQAGVFVAIVVTAHQARAATAQGSKKRA
jgi:hypothetical protein